MNGYTGSIVVWRGGGGCRLCEGKDVEGKWGGPRLELTPTNRGGVS